MGFTSPYTPNTDSDRRVMLDAIGVDSVDDLFSDIPAEHRNPELDLPPPTSELELRREIEAMAAENVTPGSYPSFLGGGSYRHFVPAVVRQIASRSEFMTSYTPYQPEVSQGTLQAHYEFQSMVCQLTGMEVANAGMYDGATSMAEAVLMASRLTRRDRVAVLDTVSPYYRDVLATYVQAPGLRIDTISPDDDTLDDDTACLVVQQPGFLGYVEDLEALSRRAHDSGALLIVVADPMSLAMFRPPGDYDADIVVAEGQPMGIAPTYGGPYVGIFACKQRYVRQMPGRIVGRTVDSRGRTGYVLTLQAREQHIRREKATSNICTSVGLIALMSAVYMAAQGRQRTAARRRVVLPQGALRRVVDPGHTRLLSPHRRDLLPGVRRPVPEASRGDQPAPAGAGHHRRPRRRRPGAQRHVALLHRGEQRGGDRLLWRTPLPR